MTISYSLLDLNRVYTKWLCHFCTKSLKIINSNGYVNMMGFNLKIILKNKHEQQKKVTVLYNFMLHLVESTIFTGFDKFFFQNICVTDMLHCYLCDYEL